jgi:hypothetical protein
VPRLYEEINSGVSRIKNDADVDKSTEIIRGYRWVSNRKNLFIDVRFLLNLSRYLKVKQYKCITSYDLIDAG